MPNLDALLARSAHGTLRSIDPAGDHGRLDDHDDRLRPGPARRLRPPLLRRRRRPDEGQPLGPRPRADLLAPALRGRPVGRQPERAGDVSAARRPGRRRLGDGRAAPRRRALRRARVRRAAAGRGARLHPPLLLEAGPAVARRADRERPARPPRASAAGPRAACSPTRWSPTGRP